LWPKWDAFGVGSPLAALAAGAETLAATTATAASVAAIVLVLVEVIVASFGIGRRRYADEMKAR
jgi:ammonia channel protein AmtB